MRYIAYLLTLVVSQCMACDLVTTATLRRDVEKAFVTKSFAKFVKTYGPSSSVTLKLEDEYDEDQPNKAFHFKNLSELSAWFYDQHQYASHMIIPDTMGCSNLSCTYEIPELTLHHGVYLTGFKGHVVGKCTTLIEVSIYWG